MSRAVFQRATGGRAPRIKVAGLVRLQFATAEEFLVAEAVDLSQSGMFIGGEEVTLACVGDVVGVHFEVAGELVIEAVARVARVVPPGGPFTPGIGIAFIKMGRDIEELILHYVEAGLSHG
ncbi:MAG TPA: PilZ domain-containing protein [Myxococcales bacterium]|nr:PilZ domain-containing protein [Myxococcales bacterium]